MWVSPWASLLAVRFLPLRHFRKRNVPYSESPTHSVSYFIWERICRRVLPATCGLNFHSLLPISTLLLIRSPSEPSTQYAAEIIFCWMRFGHKSRADLLRPLNSLFPSLRSTWQFKSLITLTRNPFPAGQSRPAMSSPSCTWAVGNVVLRRYRQRVIAQTQECAVFSGTVKVFPHTHCFFSTCLCPQKAVCGHTAKLCLPLCPLLEKQENTAAVGVTN